MLRIIFNESSIIMVMENTADMGTTYTLDRVIVCTMDEALTFFKGYPEEELSKIMIK